MHKISAAILAATAALGFAATANAQIVRHNSTPPGGILQAVTIPANAEILALSGAVASPIDPTKRPDSFESYGDTKTQTISVLNNIKKILAEHGYKMSDVVRMTAFVAPDPKRTDGKMDFAGMNEGYRQFFGTAENPNVVARSTVEVAGLAGPYFLVEIEVTAAKISQR